MGAGKRKRKKMAREDRMPPPANPVGRIGARNSVALNNRTAPISFNSRLVIASSADNDGNAKAYLYY